MFCFNIATPLRQLTYFFPSSMLVPCWFTVFIFWPGHSTTKCQACFWMFLLCFEVVNQRENYKWTTFYCEMLSSRMGCSRLLTLCSRFAHALLTLAEVPFESFRFLLSPYQVPFGSLRGSAHGLFTVCSRFARAAHALLMLCSRFGGWCVYLDEETHKQTMPLFCCSEPCVPKAHSFQAADCLRLIFKSEKKRPHATHNPSLKRGCHTPASAWDMYVTFLLSPKDSESTSYIMVLWHVPL